MVAADDLSVQTKPQLATDMVKSIHGEDRLPTGLTARTLTARMSSLLKLRRVQHLKKGRPMKQNRTTDETAVHEAIPEQPTKPAAVETGDGGRDPWHLSTCPVWHRFRGSCRSHRGATRLVASRGGMGLWRYARHLCFGGSFRAHLNPAVSLAFALWRPQDFPWRRLVPYIAAQLVGAIAAGATVAGLFWPFIARFEVANGLTRGSHGSELSAMIFGEYFPNPAMFGTDAAARALVSPGHAAVVEGFGTAVLVLVIFALTTPRNTGSPKANLVPFFIGFTVAVLISLFAPLTQAGWNPARDFGPRLVAYVLGWGTIAIPGPMGGFWVYIVGPMIGGPLGGWVWQLVHVSNDS